MLSVETERFALKILHHACSLQLKYMHRHLLGGMFNSQAYIIDYVWRSE